MKKKKKGNTSTKAYKSSWENVNKIAKLYQCPFPCCSSGLQFRKMLLSTFYQGKGYPNSPVLLLTTVLSTDNHLHKTLSKKEGAKRNQPKFLPETSCD